MILITNQLISHNGITPLFFLNGNPITLEAVMYGLNIALMLVTVLIWFKCYNEVMTSEKFIYLFGKAVPKLSLLLSMILRYIPMLKRQIKKVNNAQKAMGLYTSDSYFDKLKKGINVFSSLVTWSLENSIETSMSMKARGYGLKGRTSYSMFSFKKRDLFLLSSVILLWVVVLLGSFFNQLEFFFYPSISEINKSVFAVLCYISYGILVILPFINELKENIKWKYYVSRI